MKSLVQKKYRCIRKHWWDKIRRPTYKLIKWCYCNRCMKEVRSVMTSSHSFRCNTSNHRKLERKRRRRVGQRQLLVERRQSQSSRKVDHGSTEMRSETRLQTMKLQKGKVMKKTRELIPVRWLVIWLQIRCFSCNNKMRKNWRTRFQNTIKCTTHLLKQWQQPSSCIREWVVG